MRIFFSAGEPSGDTHGANLIQAFQAKCPEVDCVGFGGPKMRAAGCDVHFDLTTLAFMGFTDVLKNLRKFFQLADQAEEFFRRGKPDAVVLIDYPGFHWHIAHRAAKLGIPVFYYSPPQVWSWRQSRVKKMRRDFTQIFSGLPFETRWLRERGCPVTYVGHPFFDETAKGKTLEPVERGRWQVGLLPGSRMSEVRKNVPAFLRAVEKIQARQPNATFVFAAFNDVQADWIRRFLEEQNQTDIPVYAARTPEVMRTSHCCLTVSGSVSLELLAYETPSVILYQVTRPAWWFQWYFRCVKYITLVNLLAVENPFRRFSHEYTPTCADAAEVIFPEYLTCRDRSTWIASDISRWLEDSAAYQQTVERMRQLNAEMAHPGAAEKTVEEILKHLASLD